MTQLLVLILAGGLALWGIFFATVRSSFGLGAVLVALFITHSFGRVGLLQVGSVTLDSVDAVTVIVLSAGLLRLILWRSVRPAITFPTIAFAVYALCELGVVAYSALKFGEASFQVSRTALQHVACIVYLMSFPITDEVLEKWFRLVMAYAAATVGLFVLRVIGLLPLAPSIVRTLGGDSYVSLRYLVNYQTLALAFMALSLLLLRWSGRLRGAPLANAAILALVVIVVVVPQRMVWLLFALGLCYLAYAYTRKAMLYAAVLAAALLLAAPWLTGSVGHGGPLSNTIALVTGAALDPIKGFASSTAGARLSDWEFLIADTLTSGQASFGRGYVPSLSRYSNQAWVTFGIHNLVVSKFVYGGLLLSGALVLLWLAILRSFIRRDGHGIQPESKRILGMALLGMVLFSMTSAPGPEFGLALGACLSMLTPRWADERKSVPPAALAAIPAAPEDQEAR